MKAKILFTSEGILSGKAVGSTVTIADAADAAHLLGLGLIEEVKTAPAKDPPPATPPQKPAADTTQASKGGKGKKAAEAPAPPTTPPTEPPAATGTTADTTAEAQP